MDQKQQKKDGKTKPVVSAYKAFKMASDLWDIAFSVKLHQLRKANPDKDETWLQQKTIEVLQGAS